MHFTEHFRRLKATGPDEQFLAPLSPDCGACWTSWPATPNPTRKSPRGRTRAASGRAPRHALGRPPKENEADIKAVERDILKLRREVAG
jgi:hypothetical protein